MVNNTTNGIVIGYFPLRAQAEAALQRLREAAFPKESIGVASHALEGMQAGQAPIPGSLWDKVAHAFGSHKQEDRERAAEHFRTTLEQTGIAPERARYFVRRLGSRDEGALVTVAAPGREGEAELIMEGAGADLGRNTAAASAEIPRT
ncbi:MAG TPA: hypothetical protein VN661_03495 [Candidatus Acidoferrales bacterium]|nr:hypothetical protein [Candidatus Acidoferrales bacterium]